MRLGVRSTFGMMFLGFAAIVLLGEVLTLMDAAGIQNIDEPSGTPMGWKAHAAAFAVIAALAAAAWWLLIGGMPKHNTPTHQRNRG